MMENYRKNSITYHISRVNKKYFFKRIIILLRKNITVKILQKICYDMIWRNHDC